MRRILLLFQILGCLTISGSAQNINRLIHQQIDGWLNTPELANTSIGVAISDIKTGEMLFKSEPQLSLAPASILKIVTTATTLEVFGPDFRFQTKLLYSGIIRNDTLFGDLQVIGGGDPTLGSNYFPDIREFLDEWVKAVQSKNIRTVKGNLIADASIYESQMIPNTWIWEDIGNYYGAGASGLSVFDNLYEIHLSSENVSERPTKILRINPEIPNLDLQNEVLSSDLNSDQAYVFGSPMESKRVIRGTIPKGKIDFIVKASVPNPPSLLVDEFRKKLKTAGISISGETKFEKAGYSGNLLLETQSQPLRDIIRVTNHESVNLFAEHFLKHLAFQKTGIGTTKGGCQFITEFWKEKGLDMSGFFMNDGSGLSRFNAVTASQMVAILNYMKTKSAFSADYDQSLPTAGDGTLSRFSQKDFPNHCLRAKSGSMTRVRCVAGYLSTISGRQLSFAVMLNNFSCSPTEATKKIEKLLLEMRKL
jgi:D-alanyl-D-alanine carboxypeptidase/D-alanyl-D-alanine-endopeptidase (penicillin-binding protein 4)